MLNLDKDGTDKLLLQLEEGGYIDQRYKFYRVNNELSLLGKGGFSYVYEMYDTMAPDRHYAAKIIGAGNRDIDERLVSERVQIQYFLSEQSENIMRIIALWAMKLHLDNNGDLAYIIRENQENYNKDNGVRLEIILMEKEEEVIAKDKYGNAEIKCEELKTEKGVIKLAENIGRALFTIHNNRFLHRDVKLENIFWDSGLRQYKLGDFGIARYVGEGDAETVVFTDGYGAPEIERQLEESYNLTADVYSFGITLYLLLNDLKFPASDGYHVNIVQYSKDFVLPAPAHASENMAGIIRKMCSYRVEDRYQSVEEVLMDIGRLDGSYTDSGFTEYDDLETVTYREQSGDSAAAETGTPDSRENNKDDLEDNEEIPWWEKKESELTREERREKIKFENGTYTSGMVWRMLITAVLTFLMLCAFSPDAFFCGNWEFRIVPIALLVASILQRIKEFHVEWTAFTVGAAIFSMYYLGTDVSHIIAIIAVLTGIPSITAGVSIGMGFWTVHMLTGGAGRLLFLSRWDIGWVVLIAFAAVIEGCLYFRIAHKKSNRYEINVISRVMNVIWIPMIAAGVVLWLLGRFNVIVIPDMVKQIHFVRTGIGILIVDIFYMWDYGLFDKEEETVDEFLDE